MEQLIIFCAEYLHFVVVIATLFYLVIVSKKRSSEVIVALLVALPLTYIVARVISEFYYDPRPFVVGHFAPLLSQASDNGFPSSYTLFSTALATIVFAFQRRLGALLLLVAFFVGITRMMVGIHHVSDIMGSIVIASLVTYVVSRWLLPVVWKHMPKSAYTFFMK